MKKNHHLVKHHHFRFFFRYFKEAADFEKLFRNAGPCISRHRYTKWTSLSVSLNLDVARFFPELPTVSVSFDGCCIDFATSVGKSSRKIKICSHKFPRLPSNTIHPFSSFCLPRCCGMLLSLFLGVSLRPGVVPLWEDLAWGNSFLPKKYDQV